MDWLLSRYLEYAESKARICGLPNGKCGMYGAADDSAWVSRVSFTTPGFEKVRAVADPAIDELGEFYD
jgi:hypothetical protein